MSFYLLSKRSPTSKVRRQLRIAAVIVPRAHFTWLFRSAITSYALAYIINNLNWEDSVKVQSHLANLVAESSTCLAHLANLVCNVDFPLPDGLIFKMSSLSIKIVFSTEPPEGKEATAMIETALSGALGGRAGLKSFKAGAMNVLKAVCARYVSRILQLISLSIHSSSLVNRPSSGTISLTRFLVRFSRSRR